MTSTNDEIRRRGDEVMQGLRHGSPPERQRYLFGVPGMERHQAEVMGWVWARPGLPVRERLLVTLTVLGILERDRQLRSYLHTALKGTLTADEAREMLLQTGVFAGSPVTVNCLELLRTVLEERGDSLASAPVDDVDFDRRESVGRSVCVDWFGTEDPELPLEAARHLRRVDWTYSFGTILSRPGLAARDRVLCAIASCVAVDDTQELAAWAGAGLRRGLTGDEIAEVVLQTAFYVGFPAARRAMRVVSEVPGVVTL